MTVRAHPSPAVAEGSLASDGPRGRGNRGRGNRGRAAILVGAVGAGAVVHALLVGRLYHVGSFDDDASYVMAGRALAAGHGITSRLAGGYPLIGVYPPGYAALLSPLAAIWPSGTLAFRVLSLALFVAVFPLTWAYLGRRQVAEWLRVAVLVLMALNPVLATYASMVMPEMAFVVVLLLMVLALDRWERDPRTISWAGAGSVLSAAGLLYLKEAGVGLVIGVVAWLLLRRLLRKAAVMAAGAAILFVPLLVMRVWMGVSLIGSRYSSDIGGVLKGGFAARVLHVVPDAAWTYVTTAVPHAIVPTVGGFLPNDGPIGALLAVMAWTVSPLVVLGFVIWWRRCRDVTCLAVPVYLAETLIYPFTNERRVVLVLPVVVAWYVLGAAAVFAALRGAATAARGRFLPGLAAAAPVVASSLVLAALASQVTKDYLFFEGASSSSPAGSPYMALLRQLGTSHDVVETDYLWSTALFTGHRTAHRVFLANCDPRSVGDAIAADGAAYALTGALNTPGVVDDACILPHLAGLPQVVRLYRSARDLASVFELVGPGTPHPGIRDLLAGATLDGGPQPVAVAQEPPQVVGEPAGQYPTVSTTKGVAVLTWSWKQPVTISQLSLGAAGALSAATTSVTLSVRTSDGGWLMVARAPASVGAGTDNPFLLVNVADVGMVTAVRVTVAVDRPATVSVHDLHALGPGA